MAEGDFDIGEGEEGRSHDQNQSCRARQGLPDISINLGLKRCGWPANAGGRFFRYRRGEGGGHMTKMKNVELDEGYQISLQTFV